MAEPFLAAAVTIMRADLGVSSRGGACGFWSCVRVVVVIERDKSVRWMPWRQEAMKDVARCDKLRGDASDR